jgi:RNA polymerase sigma factor (sigma-70 family)
VRLASDDRLGTFLGQARSKPLLSATEELALAKRIERGDAAARERMIESNVRLVVAVARPYRGAGVPFADLVQEGMVGLVRAVERFDHHRRLKFSTYAVWWIRRSILDALVGSQVIRMPRNARGRAAAPVTVSLDETLGDGATRRGDLVADEHGVDPTEEAIAHENRQEVTTMLRLLPPRQREVLVRRYGLRNARVQSHAQIGEFLGVGEERSRQLEREALNRLRSVAGVQPRAA